MINGMLEWFSKKYGADRDQRTGFGIFAGVIGLISNFLLVAGKLTIGFLSGSVSIMADAMNNLSDGISSVLTLFGFYVAGKPADKEHPYGHERFEYISGMLVSLVITFVGFQFFLTSLGRIREPKSIHTTWVILLVLLLSVLLKIWQGLVYQQIAHRIDSGALKAASKDSMNDVFTTIAVLLSTAIESLTGLQIDGYIGLLVAIYIIFSGVQLIREFVNELMGPRPAQKEIDQMKAFLSDFDEIVGYHDLLIHQYGPNKAFASVHIEIDDRWSLNRAHQLIDQIEATFKTELAVELVCHVDPVNLYDEQQQFIHQELKRIITELDPVLKAHDIRQVIHTNGKSLLFDLVIPNKYELTEAELNQRIQKEVVCRIGNYKVIITFDYVYLL